MKNCASYFSCLDFDYVVVAGWCNVMCSIIYSYKYTSCRPTYSETIFISIR